MFTGIIQQCGTVIDRQNAAHGATLLIDPGDWSHQPGEGESISVNGCCLTVHRGAGGAVSDNAWRMLRFDVVPETLRCTTTGELRVGQRVHLEHAATPTTLLGGHIVQGHVDGVAEIVHVSRDGGEHRVRLRMPSPLRQYIIPKGSIAVNGVSLTIALVGAAVGDDNTFDVALIPATLTLTTLGSLKPGDRVNLEADYIAKIVVQNIQHVQAAGGE